VIAVDTNLLVHAHREDSPWHPAAYACIQELAGGAESWAIPWPCIHEFLAVVTHPRIYSPPTPRIVALDQVSAWLESPGLVLLGETNLHWQILQSLIEGAKVVGPRVHDARVAALCVQHGITELWSADRDFQGFQGLVTHNPLIA
jgi:toxin-antitoxin system PIN domain toxin